MYSVEEKTRLQKLGFTDQDIEYLEEEGIDSDLVNGSFESVYQAGKQTWEDYYGLDPQIEGYVDLQRFGEDIVDDAYDLVGLPSGMVACIG